MNRRQLMKILPGAAAMACQIRAAQNQPKAAAPIGLPLEQFEPKSTLHAKETKVPRSRYPLIDFHTHITWSGELTGQEKVTFTATPTELLQVMDRKNIRTMVDV